MEWNTVGSQRQVGRLILVEDNYSASRCQRVSQNDCVEKCVTKKLKDPKTRNTYAIGPLGEDCQEYSSRILSECRKECGVEYEGLISTW